MSYNEKIDIQGINDSLAEKIYTARDRAIKDALDNINPEYRKRVERGEIFPDVAIRQNHDKSEDVFVRLSDGTPKKVLTIVTVFPFGNEFFEKEREFKYTLEMKFITYD